ncbi:MAG: ParB/RepB/Spo0J family partition protein [Flavobacteriales bacterium]
MSTPNKRRALGKGLSALLENPETDIMSKNTIPSEGKVVGSISKIPLQHIEANPFQPRDTFDEEALHELSQSILELGLIQPVTVRKVAVDKYQLISGERRFRASQRAGLIDIPAYILVADDKQMLELALVENIQREDLDAIEVALGYQRLIDECNYTHEQVSEKVSKKRSTVSNYLRLLKLPADIQLAIKEKKLSMGHARALIAIDSAEEQLNLFKKILDADLSVRETEQAAVERKPAQKTTSTPTQRLKDIEKKLNKELGSKVILKSDHKHKGALTIKFVNEAQLNTILTKLGVS